MKTRDLICEFGNCQSYDTPITVSDREANERVRFCCREHAARYLLRCCSLATLDRVQEDFGITT